MSCPEKQILSLVESISCAMALSARDESGLSKQELLTASRSGIERAFKNGSFDVPIFPIYQILLRLSNRTVKSIKVGALFNAVNENLVAGNELTRFKRFNELIVTLSDVGHVIVDRSATDGPAIAFTEQGLEFATQEFGGGAAAA